MHLQPFLPKTWQKYFYSYRNPLEMRNQLEELNNNPQSSCITNPARNWERTLVSALAEVIVQFTKETWHITLSTSSERLKTAIVKISSVPVILKPEVEAVKR
jgi:hypothetical protein